MKLFVTLSCIIMIVFIGYFLLKPQMYTSKGKISILMTGRSTMMLWFKHWNWPYPLRIKTTYKNWPIGYKKYATDNLYMDYHSLPGPVSRETKKTFGQDMLREFEAAIDSKLYDAVFFKFCFVDFKVNEKTIDTRFYDLIHTVESAHNAAKKRNMKIIFGSSLPLLNPNDSTVQLQKKFNFWLSDFAKKYDDVLCFDLYTALIDDSGILRGFYSRGKDDPHLNDKAFGVLDKSLFEKLPKWLKKVNNA